MDARSVWLVVHKIELEKTRLALDSNVIKIESALRVENAVRRAWNMSI